MRYRASLHERQVADWHAGHGIAWDPEGVSDEGYIVPGVAAGWFWRTNGPVAFIEGVITRPNTPASVRDAALNEIHEWAKRRASEVKARKLVALIEHNGLAHRAASYGYRVAGKSTVLVKEIE